MATEWDEQHGGFGDHNPESMDILRKPQVVLFIFTHIAGDLPTARHTPTR